METKHKEIIELNNLLETYSFMYHTLGRPTVIDSVYDELYQKLLKLEAEHPEYKVKDGITSRVGNIVLDGLKKYTRPKKLLSLSNGFNVEEVLDFLEYQEPASYIANGKLDGLALELLYINGKLEVASTR